MATRQLKAMIEKGTHEVGNLSSIQVRTLNHGALVGTADIDNYTLVELGFNAENERICKQLSDETVKSYLIASPEARYLGEEMVDFYNAVGERARIIYLDEGLRFDTSAFTKNAGVTEIVNGQVAHFDAATKKFMVSAAGSAHADYAGAKAKFLVVADEDDSDYNLGKAVIRLEVTES